MREMPRAQILQAVGNPIDVLLARGDHLAFDARALRAGNHEQVWKPRDHDPEICARPVLPFLLDRHFGIGVNIDLFHRPGHGAEPGGEDDSIELVFGISGQEPRGRDFSDRLVSDIDQRHVVPIVRLVVIGI
jgi:hypothetical protein